jgi:hypothetical protein
LLVHQPKHSVARCTDAELGQLLCEGE